MQGAISVCIQERINVCGIIKHNRIRTRHGHIRTLGDHDSDVRKALSDELLRRTDVVADGGHPPTAAAA